MDPTALHAKLLWSCLQTLTRERYDAVIQVFGNLEEAARHIDSELLRGLGCREETIANVLQRLDKCDPEQEEKLLQQANAGIVALGDESYPDRLRDVSDPPIFLYYRGDLSVLEQPCIALVGTRRISPYGKRVTEEFTRALVHAKIVIVSGLARGVDALAAEQAMQAGGKTVAVLGQGLLTLSAASRELADRIVAGGGLVVSEYPLRCAPDIFTFPMRNRIIAGLSLATVVLEAPESSGALITAKLAFDYGREVFAVPGQIFDPNFAGSHAFIKKQTARLASCPRDVLTELGVIVPADDGEFLEYVPQNPEEGKILNALTTMPQSIDDLLVRSGCSAGTVNATLTLLELNGVAKNVGSSQWVRC
jgi:DNA processing protein